MQLLFFIFSFMTKLKFLLLQLPSEAVLTHIIGAPGIAEWFEGATESGNPDALLLALKIHKKIGGSHPTLGRLLPDPFSPSRFFASDHLSSLANCFKVISQFPILLLILITIISSTNSARKGEKVGEYANKFL